MSQTTGGDSVFHGFQVEERIVQTFKSGDTLLSSSLPTALSKNLVK